jgi:hypothetical protein
VDDNKLEIIVFELGDDLIVSVTLLLLLIPEKQFAITKLQGLVILVMLLQSSKALTPTCVIFEGIVTLVKPLQPENILLAIKLFNRLVSSNFVNPVHPLK